MHTHMYTIICYMLFKSIGSDDACNEPFVVDSTSMITSNHYNATSNLLSTTETAILPKEGIYYILC